MPKERISRSPRENREISGVLWPTHPLPTELLTKIVDRSNSRSLREIIGGLLSQEASDMWEQYKEQFAPPPDYRYDQDIAIREGYAGIANDLLHASKCFNDRETAVGFDMAAYNVAQNHFNIDPDEATDKSVRETMEGRMHAAVESLTIDPSGIDWLTRELNKNKIVWNGYSSATKYGGDDPQVLGYRKGFARYKSFYRQAVDAGATPDRGNNITRRMSLKLKRRVVDIFSA